jgi:hypothetical protein
MAKMIEPEVNTTNTYSASQKLSLYYKELADSNPAWRPLCSHCHQAGRGKHFMIKTKESGFECLVCKFTVNCYMHKEK